MANDEEITSARLKPPRKMVHTLLGLPTGAEEDVEAEACEGAEIEAAEAGGGTDSEV